ncbi:MAG: class II glutamine amidotransferase, partial [Alphaproteobacteria bacterium]|nr:class II glutamine amidotransferase [Alphaproteobacteria bacterium]
MGKSDVVQRLLEGLKRLEYRGYDSSGVAVIHDDTILRRRAAGKIANLEATLQEHPIKGNLGIGHTRWATHGEATTYNAHPHGNEHVCLVHNGIIENFAELKKDLQEKGHVFESETDTEVIVHQLSEFLTAGLEPLEAVQKTLSVLEGAFSLVIMFQKYPNLMICTRSGSPLVLGQGQDEVFVGSDALALAPWTQDLIYLKEKDIVVIESESPTPMITIYNDHGQVVTR